MIPEDREKLRSKLRRLAIELDAIPAHKRADEHADERLQTVLAMLMGMEEEDDPDRQQSGAGGAS